MYREIFEIANLTELASIGATGPVRFVFLSRRRGGPALRDIRVQLQAAGWSKLRVSGTPLRLFVDVARGGPELPVVALDMIARSDAEGLERALLSVVSLVDEIVIGIDGRSDAETRQVAEAYADVVWTFEAKDLELSDEAWAANKIDFARARNLGRAQVRAPWTFVIDTDEYVAKAVDLRAVVEKVADIVVAFDIAVDFGEGTVQPSGQRLARTMLRWWSAAHNQLLYKGDPVHVYDMVIVHDTSLRTAVEIERRNGQRQNGIEYLITEIPKGNLVALLHVAKHKLGNGEIEEAAKLIQDFRLKSDLHGSLVEERKTLAFMAAVAYYEKDDFCNAEMWAVRTLLDGPCMEAFCLLGDVAEDMGDLTRALEWYECACALPERSLERRLSMTRLSCVVEIRFGRRDWLRHTLTSAGAEIVYKMPVVEFVTEAPPPNS